MGVYSLNNNNNIDVELNRDSYIECHLAPGMEASMNIVAEAEINWNRLTQAVGIQEFNYYEATGEEMVYTEASGSGFFDSVKKFFLNLWEKIKGLFRKFFALIGSYTKTDKQFVDKYKKHLLSVNTRDFKYKGYKFTKLTDNCVDAAYKNAISSIESDVKDLELSANGALKDVELKIDDKQDVIEKARANAIGQTGSLDGTEFTKELFMLFRNGEDQKEELDNINVSEQLVFISENSKLEKAAKDNYKTLEKTIKEAIKAVEKAEKEALKGVPTKDQNGAFDKDATSKNSLKVQYAHAKFSFLKEAETIATVVNGAQLTAIKDQNRQAKAICVSLMNYKPKNESTSFEEGAFLSGVNFI